MESKAEVDVDPWRINVPEDEGGDGKGDDADIDDFRPEEPPGDETAAGRRKLVDDESSIRCVPATVQGKRGSPTHAPAGRQASSQ